MEPNQQGAGQGRGRRGNFHRGRRGPDRRPQGGQEPRASQPSEPQAPRGEHVDVEQIMRDIRARIAQRHGIDLSTQQVHELAARRLEAILDPRNIDPRLLEQLRKAAGARPVKDVVSAPAEPAYTFEDTTLYDSHRGLLRTIRKLLNPILRLFFNPNPIVHALNAQARLNAELAARESQREQQQAEWNALHYELVRRVVTESAKLSVELQALTLRVESLATRVDFADRRVRTLEAAPAASAPRHSGRPAQEPAATTAPAAVAAIEMRADRPPAAAAPSSDAPSLDGQRKRRRRRRGRRSGGSLGDGSPSQADPFATKDSGPEPFDDSPDDASDHATDEGDSEPTLRSDSQDAAAQPDSQPPLVERAADQTSPAEPPAAFPVPVTDAGSSEPTS